MRNINVRLLPSYTACARSAEDGALLILIPLVDTGGDPTNDAVRIPVEVDGPEGVDVIETVGAAIGNRQPLTIGGDAEWEGQRGAWNILRVDWIADPRKQTLAA